MSTGTHETACMRLRVQPEFANRSDLTKTLLGLIAISVVSNGPSECPFPNLKPTERRFLKANLEIALNEAVAIHDSYPRATISVVL